VYLNSKFKEETNYTFNDFLNRYRILKAVELLKEGDLLIYEIAEQVGFQDYKYFSQVFKKYIGQPPTEFLNSMGQ
jgi:two-component system response regulator YesN